jgi:CheY-like chemotaxis protein
MTETARPRRILVVDDDEFVRLMVGHILAAGGYEVDMAREGAEAIERIEKSRPDLVILDLVMPGLDGWAVLDHLHRSEAAPPVVVVTGHGDLEVFARTAREGVVGYLSKPFSLHELLLVSARVLMHPEPAAEGAARERRLAPRRTLMVQAKVLQRATGVVGLGEIVDVSPGGAQIDMDVPLEAGEQVQLNLRVPGAEPPPSLEARVAWMQETQGAYSHGLVFINITPDEEERLRHLLGWER